MGKLAALVFKFVVLVFYVNRLINAKVLPQNDVSYSQCIQKTFEIRFVGESVLVILPKFHTHMSDRFTQMLHESYAVTIVDKNQKSTATTLSPLSKSSRPKNFLFLTTGRKDLIQSIDYLKSNKLWNPMARVIAIFIANRKSLLNMSEMKKIFRIFVKERSLKVNVLTFDEHHVPSIFAWFPYDDENDCSNRVRVIQSVGKCLSDGNVRTKGYVVKTNYYDLPIMPSIFTGCPLHIIAFQTEPYVICNDQSACDEGLEVRLFESVSESLKLNLKLKVEEKVDEIMYSRILKRESDLSIGGINPLVKTRDQRFTQTVPYYQDELTWCVLEAPNISLWFSLFLVFDDEVWGYFTTITLVCGIILRYFVKFHYHPENYCYCGALGFFLAIGIPVPVDPTHRALRIIFLAFSIYGILLTTTFNSFFMSRMTKPVRYKQISARQDLITNSMKLYAENETIAMHRGNELSEYVTQNIQRCTDTNSCLETLLSSSSNDIAVAVSREHAIHNIGMRNESNIYCFHRSENIYVYPVAALAHEHYHLLDAINYQIQRILEAGLIIKWNADIKLTTRKANAINHPVPFTIVNVSGAFVVLMIGVTLSTTAFALEHYFKRKRKSSPQIQPSFWRVCESIWVTPERDGWTEIGRFVRWKMQKKNK